MVKFLWEKWFSGKADGAPSHFFELGEKTFNFKLEKSWLGKKKVFGSEASTDFGMKFLQPSLICFRRSSFLKPKNI